jgi:hypothetical protein
MTDSFGVSFCDFYASKHRKSILKLSSPKKILKDRFYHKIIRFITTFDMNLSLGVGWLFLQ